LIQTQKSSKDMSNSSTNSTDHLPPEQQFRRQAIDFIGRVIRARTFLVKHQTGRRVAEETILPVRNQYKAYRRSWTPRGVAIFITRYQNNLLDMTTSAGQIQELIELIHNSKKYV
jgi:hypothetical protein